MKRRTVALFLLTAALTGLLTGCSREKVEPIFYPGTWEDDQFESSFIDLAFALPQGWETVGGDELAGMNAAADEALDIQKGGTGEDPESFYHYELSAKDPKTGEGVLILAYRTAMNADDYMTGLKHGAKAEGSTFTLGDALEIDLAGNEFTVLPLTVEGEQAPYQRQYLRTERGFLITIMMFSTTGTEEAFTQLEGYFTQLSA